MFDVSIDLPIAQSMLTSNIENRKSLPLRLVLVGAKPPEATRAAVLTARQASPGMAGGGVTWLTRTRRSRCQSAPARMAAPKPIVQATYSIR